MKQERHVSELFGMSWDTLWNHWIFVPNIHLVWYTITRDSFQGRWTSSSGSYIEDISRRFRWQWQVDDTEDLRATYQNFVREKSASSYGATHCLHWSCSLQHWLWCTNSMLGFSDIPQCAVEARDRRCCTAEAGGYVGECCPPHHWWDFVHWQSTLFKNAFPNPTRQKSIFQRHQSASRQANLWRYLYDFGWRLRTAGTDRWLELVRYRWLWVCKWMYHY